MKDMIIKLKNGKDYYVLDKLLYNDKEYILVVLCDLEKDDINEEELIIMEVKVNNDELIVDEIYDDNLAQEVATLFKQKIQNTEENHI